jgi:hypothetical protein
MNVEVTPVSSDYCACLRARTSPKDFMAILNGPPVPPFCVRMARPRVRGVETMP